MNDGRRYRMTIGHIEETQFPIFMEVFGDYDLFVKEYLEECKRDESLANGLVRWWMSYIGDTPCVLVHFKSYDDISHFEEVMGRIFQRKKNEVFAKIENGCVSPDSITHPIIDRCLEKCKIRNEIRRWLNPFLRDLADRNFYEALNFIQMGMPPELVCGVYKVYKKL